MKFSKLATSLVGSATMAATLKAQELKRSGRKIFLGTVGEPDTDVSTNVKQALANQVLSHPSRYGPSQGLLSTRKAISRWFHKIYDADFKPEHIVITPGSKFGLYALLQVLCDAGDEVIIPAPYWVSYVTLTEMSGAIPKIAIPDQSYKLTPAELKKNLNEKTRVLILNSPNNPTGATYTIPELRALYEVLRTYPDVTILCDDIYNQLCFDSPKRAPSLLDIAREENDKDFQKRLILVHGVSKSFAMTGWRLGWIATTEDCAKKLAAFFSQTLTCTPDFIQIAAEEALSSGDAFVEELRQSITKRHASVVEILSSVPKVKVFASEGAFNVWIRLLDENQSSMEVADRLLDEVGVATVPGEAFGMPFHLRLSVTMEQDELTECANLVKKFFS